jgi:hypothetical protein
VSASLLLLAEHHVAVRRLLADQTPEEKARSAQEGVRGLGILFCLFLGFLGFREARKVRAQTGRPSGGLEPWAWFLLCCFIPVIGLVALAITSRSTRKKTAVEANALVGSLPEPYVPARGAVPQPPMTAAEAWAAPGTYQSQGSGFPPPAPAAPTVGSRIAIDVLPAVKAKRRFR